MYSRIVVGYDGRAPAQDALALAGCLARSAEGSLLLAYIATEQPRWYRTERDYRRALRKEVEDTLDPAFNQLSEGLTARKASIESASPARGLHDLAAEDRATLLVLGSTHRGSVGRILIGSVGELLLMGAPCAVVVAPKGYAERAGALNTIAVGFNGSEESHGALMNAYVLATASGARLRVISVVETNRPFRRQEAHGGEGMGGGLEKEVDDALGKLPANLEIERSVVEGDPVKSLASAGQEADLLIIGSRGYGPMHHVLLGSVSAKLMRCASCPVLVVPRGARPPVEGTRAEASATTAG
jgi:nucleotide-binding universal stress UspA family protein